MSVVVMTKFPGKATNLEEVVRGEHADTLRAVSAAGQQTGAIHHMFVEDTDGSALVIDEWESREAFDAFFASQEDIRKMAADAGVTGPPVSTTYRILDTPDRF